MKFNVIVNCLYLVNETKYAFTNLCYSKTMMLLELVRLTYLLASHNGYTIYVKINTNLISFGTPQ